MTLAARVVRIEAKQKQVLRCLWCRFTLRDHGPCSRPPKVEDMLATRCWYCGTKFTVPLRNLNQYQREAVDLIYNSHPTEAFTCERIYAAKLWFSLYQSEMKEYRQALEDQERPRTSSESRARSASASQRKAERERSEMMFAALDFRERQTERFKRLAKGPEKFPLDQCLHEIDRAHPSRTDDPKMNELIETLNIRKASNAEYQVRSGLAACNVHLSNLKKREACEVVLWGKPLADTLTEIAFFDAEKASIIQKASQPNISPN